MEPTVQIIAWDPGLTTGLCIIETTEDGTLDWHQTELDTRGVGELLLEFTNLKVFKEYCVVVCESFTINQQTARNSQAPWSLEMIGVIRHYAELNNLELQLQQPSAAKNLVTDDVIKRSGHWVRGKPHAMDATRHALYHLFIEKKEKREWLIPPSE